MNTGIFFGIMLIAAGAFFSGSFAVPFSKIKNWKWETYWMVFSLAAYILFPLTACFLFIPEYITVLSSVSFNSMGSVFLMGAVYGIGNLSFGLALRYLGLSLGYALSLGLMLAIGTLIPPLIDGRLKIMMEESGGMLLIAGVITACFGIALSAWAGILKDKFVSDSKKQESVNEFNLAKGAMAAVLVGFAGSAMSMGFEQGVVISDTAVQSGVDPLFSMMPVMLVLLSGTFVTTILWCGYLGIKNNSLKEYVNVPDANLVFNYVFGLLAGFLWFAQFIVYGMGKSKMGPYTFTSWGILMALTIAFATIWGLLRKEWKGAPVRVYILMVFSLIIIIISAFMIGISGSE